MAKVNIKRGSDKSFVIRLRTPEDDPIDLTAITQITVKIPKKDNTKLSINMDLTPASQAKILYQGATFQAVTAGPGGNSIALVFDGLQTVDTVVDAWNLANPSNQVSYSGVAGTLSLAAGTAQLTNGLSSYNKVSKLSPEVLGKIKIQLRDPDTIDLKLGQSVAIEVLLDEGAAPEGNQSGVVLPDAVNIL